MERLLKRAASEVVLSPELIATPKLKVLANETVTGAPTRFQATPSVDWNALNTFPERATRSQVTSGETTLVIAMIPPPTLSRCEAEAVIRSASVNGSLGPSDAGSIGR